MRDFFIRTGYYALSLDFNGLAPAALTLTLLMLGVLADNHDFTLALDDLALFAHGLHGRSNFHFFTSYLLLQVILPRVTS